MLVSPADIVARAKATIKECTVSQAKQLLTPETLLIDIREAPEFNKGHLPGAVLSPRGLLEFEIHALVARTATNSDIAPEDRDIVLYCGTGGRSALAAETLNKMGYRNALSMDGGIVAWAAARLPIETP
ncbi:MAG: rhodanese-like domain-containing protein [Gammaproteobacteria bacterium]|nr:rhodanese-like domain-containing protein [Gammaproteobacteria bacterium]